MKKGFSWLIVLVLIFTCLCSTALADAFDNHFHPKSENIKLSPANGDVFTSGQDIRWQCSGRVYKSTGQKIVARNQLGIREVSLTIYSLPEEGTLGGSITPYTTLFCYSYNEADNVKFSESGTVTLPPGRYEFYLSAAYKSFNATDNLHLAKSVVTVYESSSSGGSSSGGSSSSSPSFSETPRYGYVDIIHLTTDDHVLHSETKTFSEGWQTINSEWTFLDYDLISESSKNIYVLPDEYSQVTFLYQKKSSHSGSSSGGSSSSGSYSQATVLITNPRTVNIRTGPGTEYDYICEVKPGSRFPYLDTQNGWHKIIYDGTHSGWLSGKLCVVENGPPGVNVTGGSSSASGSSASTPSYSNGDVVVITNYRNVNIRKGPGTNNRHFASAKPGETFTYLGTVDDWYWIIYNNKRTGWVSAEVSTLYGTPRNLRGPSYVPAPSCAYCDVCDGTGYCATCHGTCCAPELKNGGLSMCQDCYGDGSCHACQ